MEQQLPQAPQKPAAKPRRRRKIPRKVPDTAGYAKAMATFAEKLLFHEARSPATTKVALTASASRTYTHEFGVEFYILTTRLFGEERIKFSFENTDQRHFAIQIYGNVYEYGPFDEIIRKTDFLTWCGQHPMFEYASVMDTRYNNKGEGTDFRRPVVAHTMQSEEEFDNRVDIYIQRMKQIRFQYHPEDLNGFTFVKFASMTLNRDDQPDSEMQIWINKLQETLSPAMRKVIHTIQKRMHRYAGYLGIGRKVDEIVLDDDDKKRKVDEAAKCHDEFCGCSQSKRRRVFQEVDLTFSDNEDDVNDVPYRHGLDSGQLTSVPLDLSIRSASG